ncbi:MAG: glycosyltransferase family 2 protein [Desulfobacteraceae bacterium]|nr:glycosyltransferase family 2 protein [Desulfobacteraceae bacterium]MBC2756903.1 glycosyltransferase family 2 protein [Desulfobacteraceae bacterium]
MYKGKTIVVVIPAHNEETQISRVIETMPNFVDQMIIIDDKSTDKTIKVVKEYQKKNDRIKLFQHETNQGVGGAIATGYKFARDQKYDVAVVMAGDGQMDPQDLTAILDPVVEGRTDYSKGNRLFTGEAYQKIPKVRYFGNAFLSLLTKIASGYWHIADSQSGYTAINLKALQTIDWDKMYQWYGQPNDILVKLNVHNFKVTDIPVEPVYNIGEKSGIKIRKVIFTISWLLIKLFFWRMKEKYIIRDFHPLVFFYTLGGFFYFFMILLFARVFYYWIFHDYIPAINALAAFFSFMSGSLFTLFAMWFDMESNKELK